MAIDTYDSGNGGATLYPTPGNGNGNGNGNGGGNGHDGDGDPTTVAELLKSLEKQANATAGELADTSATTQKLTKSKANLQKQIGDLTKTSNALAGKRKAAQAAVDNAEQVIDEYTPLLEYQIPEDLREGIVEVIDEVNTAVEQAGTDAEEAATTLDNAERELRDAVVADADADQALRAAQAALNGLVTEIQDLTTRVNNLAKEVAAKQGASLEEEAYWRLQQLIRARERLADLIKPETEQERVAAVVDAAEAAAEASEELRDRTAARDTAKLDHAAKDAEWKARQQSREADIKQKIDDLVNSPPDADGAGTLAAAGSRGGSGAGSP